ncbi:MAG: M60 family metallopeptidase [Verrucomicrobiota bacterium]
MKFSILSSVTIAVLVARISAAPTDDADRAALLKGVAEINTGGIPGGVSAFGPDAFAVVAGKDAGGALLPIVSAARWDKGRLVAAGHDGFFRTANESGNGAFLANAARWVSGTKTKPKIGILKNDTLLEHLKASGLDAVALDEKDWSAKLDGLDAVCLSPFWLKNEEIPSLERFIRSGGGLLAGTTGWGWVQIFRKDNRQLASEYPGNILLEKAGLAFTGGMPARTLPQAFATGGDLKFLNATTALQALTDNSGRKNQLAPAAVTQCAATVADALRSLPPDDRILLPKIAALSSETPSIPKETTPIRSSDAISRLMLTRETEILRSTKPEQLKAHPAAEAFPGTVVKSAPRLAERTIAVDVSIPQWHSTGLYAAPGEVIRVTIPQQAANKGVGVRIGCHTDALWHLDQWKRMPEISRRELLKEAVTLAANPFGGLIYIDVPENAPRLVINVTISGAVEAPHFILGKTSVEDWKKRIRNHPAPWAELETKKIILSVPSEKVRLLDNPDELMTLWDKILDAEADLSTIPRERKRPERIVPDIQIGGGYMHSGYPIMTHLDGAVEQSLSTTELGKGSWGHFHELGHNHQQPDWTFGGTTEVTCNLYSLYVMETVCGKPPGQGHEAMEPGAVEKRFHTHLTSNDRFNRWKNDPFLALTMYDQLRVGFGWETYKKVFAEYRALPNTERPKNDDEKRDQWLVRFSRAAGKNLGPFFEAWGVPTTAAARQSIADLPAWMPESWPEK